jgi:hypothetical protein
MHPFDFFLDSYSVDRGYVILIFIVETSISLTLTLMSKFYLHFKVRTGRFLIEV